jgi:hypothetical protein
VEKRNTHGIGGGEQSIQKGADGIDACIYNGNTHQRRRTQSVCGEVGVLNIRRFVCYENRSGNETE